MPLAAEGAERLRNAGVERIGKIVIARPVFEQIAEDVERPGLRGSAPDEIEELLVDVRPLGAKMEIGDEDAVHCRSGMQGCRDEA